MESVEELIVAALGHTATVTEIGDHRPVGCLVQDIPYADLEQDGDVAVLADSFARETVGETVDVVFAFAGDRAAAPRGCDVAAQRPGAPVEASKPQTRSSTKAAKAEASTLPSSMALAQLALGVFVEGVGPFLRQRVEPGAV